jgi:predicted O-methyltransferase YrrM
MATVLMAANAPESKIYTVNIPPEEILAGKGGELTTVALEREKIGIAFRERSLSNITQIYANTATWKPDIGTIDVAFIDGCHDTEFVYNDTRKVLRQMKPGGFILWHDFNPDLVKKYDWINSVCLGVEKLSREGLIRGRIFHIRDSWVGIYRIPE